MDVMRYRGELVVPFLFITKPWTLTYDGPHRAALST
jgi:hypothetical protein